MGCTYLAKTPMDVLYYNSESLGHSKGLIVFLRGIGGSHRSFHRDGFVEAVQKKGFKYDMVAPNSHFGYYSERTLLTRLREDVILPSQQQGYDSIWLVGVSMGGLGSLLYLREHPEDIKGVYLIAPFLGDEKIVSDLQEAGGVQPWSPGVYNPEEDWQKMLWDWIGSEVASGQTPPIYLGSGLDDTYLDGQRLLSDVLPATNTIWVPGGHNHGTFKILWDAFLEQDIL